MPAGPEPPLKFTSIQSVPSACSQKQQCREQPPGTERCTEGPNRNKGRHPKMCRTMAPGQPRGARRGRPGPCGTGRHPSRDVLGPSRELGKGPPRSGQLLPACGDHLHLSPPKGLPQGSCCLPPSQSQDWAGLAPPPAPELSPDWLKLI